LTTMINQQVPDTYELAQAFKALADQTRLKVAFLIAYEDISVQDIAGLLGTTIQNASSHLRQLKRYGMATCRRDGKQVYYRLTPKANALINVTGEMLK
jgi:ArsR family transcriptional regulator, lead/cadmium/zinc/bismuth-responsive transcriptional repressor